MVGKSCFLQTLWWILEQDLSFFGYGRGYRYRFCQEKRKIRRELLKRTKFIYSSSFHIIIGFFSFFPSFLIFSSLYFLSYFSKTSSDLSCLLLFRIIILSHEISQSTSVFLLFCVGRYLLEERSFPKVQKGYLLIVTYSSVHPSFLRGKSRKSSKRTPTKLLVFSNLEPRTNYVGLLDLSTIMATSLRNSLIFW